MKNNKGYVVARKQKGYTLIELMVASALGLFISAGTYTMYVSNKNSIRLQSSMSEVQKNGRFLIDRLSSKIQGAGYSGFYGPLTSGLNNAIVTPTDDRWNLAFPVYGYDNVANGDTIGGVTGFQAGSDVLLLKKMSDTVGLVNGSSSSSIVLNVASGFSAGDLLLVTDSDHASLFSASAVDNTTVSGQSTVTISTATTPAPGNTAVLTNTFGTDGQVGKLESVMYYLKAGSNNRTSLFEGRLVTSSSAAPVFESKELVSNVEAMQVVYGVDTNGDENVNVYSTANAVTTAAQWGKVRNVGVSVLLSSEQDNISLAANSYSFNSTRFTFTPDATVVSGADKRLRRIYTTHVALPNL